MPKGTTDKRRLIKFSNYSMCVTLPKWVIDQLEWRKGDVLTLSTDVKQGKITLYKDRDENNFKGESPIIPAKELSESTPTNDTPKLRW